MHAIGAHFAAQPARAARTPASRSTTRPSRRPDSREHIASPCCASVVPILARGRCSVHVCCLNRLRNVFRTAKSITVLCELLIPQCSDASGVHVLLTEHIIKTLASGALWARAGKASGSGFGTDRQGGRPGPKCAAAILFSAVKRDAKPSLRPSFLPSRKCGEERADQVRGGEGPGPASAPSPAGLRRAGAEEQGRGRRTAGFKALSCLK